MQKQGSVRNDPIEKWGGRSDSVSIYIEEITTLNKWNADPGTASATPAGSRSGQACHYSMDSTVPKRGRERWILAGKDILRLHRQLYLLGVMNPLNGWSSVMLYSNTIVNSNRPKATRENFTFVSFCIWSDIIKKGKTQTTKWKAKTINHSFIENLYLEYKKNPCTNAAWNF